MKNAKLWTFTALALALLVGMALLLSTGPAARAVDEKVAIKHHWRYFDGHWSYWDPDDSRWYYTNGENWFYYDDGAWKVYRFDRRFGREGFERHDYRIPGVDARIEAPRHRVYVHRR